jgi:hypothetical protein
MGYRQDETKVSGALGGQRAYAAQDSLARLAVGVCSCAEDRQGVGARFGGGLWHFCEFLGCAVLDAVDLLCLEVDDVAVAVEKRLLVVEELCRFGGGEPGSCVALEEKGVCRSRVDAGGVDSCQYCKICVAITGKRSAQLADS